MYVILQAVEGVVILPGSTDLAEIGVKSKDLHFITAGSKGLAAKYLKYLYKCPSSPLCHSSSLLSFS